MKIYYFISFLLISFAVVSCHKEVSEEEVFRKELPGNYDWVNSTSVETNGGGNQPLITYTPDINGNNYGLRIRKNGKAFLYENGNQIKKGEVKNIDTRHDGAPYLATITYYVATIDFGNESFEFSSLSTGQYNLTNLNWPYNSYNNHFKRISK